MINPQTVLSVIGATALLAVGAWLGRCSVEEPTPRMAIEFKQDAMTKADIPEPTTPRRVTVYREPDSTRTDCIEVPTWMDTLDRKSTALARSEQDGQRQPPQSNDSSRRLGEDVRMTSIGTLAGLPYVITPMTNGRPSLSVGPEQVVLPGILPTNGRGVKFSYDIPQPSNRLSPYASAELLPGTAAVHSGLQYAHTWRDVPLFSSMTAQWSGGYGITTHGPGIVSGVTLTADIKW